MLMCAVPRLDRKVSEAGGVPVCSGVVCTQGLFESVEVRVERGLCISKQLGLLAAC